MATIYSVTIEYKPCADKEERFSRHMRVLGISERYDYLSHTGDDERDIISFSRRERVEGFLKEIQNLEFIEAVSSRTREDS